MTLDRAIAVAQTTPVRGDVEANLGQHLDLIAIAATESARILVFPELSLSGYELDLAAVLAFSANDRRLAPLVEAAVARGITVVVGAPVQIEMRRYIGAFIIRPDGTVDLYTKHHLGAFMPEACVDGTAPPPEATVFVAGHRSPLVPVGNGLGAIAICADTGHRSHAQTAADRGATTYLASMFVISSEAEREIGALRDHAVRHSMVVAAANYGGPSGGLRSAGRSGIWSEAGVPLVELPSTGSGVAIAVEEPNRWRTKAIVGGPPR